MRGERSTRARRLRAAAAGAGLLAGLTGCGGGGMADPDVAQPVPLPAPAPSPPPAPSADAVPSVTLTAPAPLADGLAGVVTLSATAGDDRGVVAVEFQVDGATVGEDTSPPYAVALDTGIYPGGQHVVRARARDTGGQVSPWSAATVRLVGGSAVPPGFLLDEQFATGLARSTAFAQAPDGRFFVCEQGGQVRIVKDGVTLPTPFHAFTVDARDERGLIGIALDPDFAVNGFVYVHYTATSPVTHNRVSRLVAAGDVSTGVETVLVDLPALSGATNHNGGGLRFGADGKLYVGVGDNADGAKAQDPAHPFGKLLRLERDGTIPADNPLCTTAGVPGCAVWALGLRNPFTFAVQPGTGRIHINDVGAAAWEEIDLGAPGANYGWPLVEGPGAAAGVTAPLYAYARGDASPPGSGPGGFLTGFAIAGGAFYPADGTFPPSFHGNYVFGDFAARWLARLDLSNDNAAYTFATLAGAPVDLLVGLDGALYVLAHEGRIARIARR